MVPDVERGVVVDDGVVIGAVGSAVEREAGPPLVSVRCIPQM